MRSFWLRELSEFSGLKCNERTTLNSLVDTDQTVCVGVKSQHPGFNLIKEDKLLRMYAQTQ